MGLPLSQDFSSKHEKRQVGVGVERRPRGSTDVNDDNVWGSCMPRLFAISEQSTCSCTQALNPSCASFSEINVIFYYRVCSYAVLIFAQLCPLCSTKRPLMLPFKEEKNRLRHCVIL